jgi:hypothetical protein
MTPISIPLSQPADVILSAGATLTVTTAAASSASAMRLAPGCQSVPIGASTSQVFGPYGADTRHMVKAVSGTVSYVFAYP